MLTNTKALFASILKALRTDCVCDIGSRDGDQALLFHHLLPGAMVIAFEANRLNFQAMQQDPRLQTQRIRIFPCAITNQNGWAEFHITDVDYSGPKEDRGTSSLLVHDGLRIKQSEKVETRRIDDFILEHQATAQSIGLWIDVESAEYWVLEGMEKILDRVVAVHVETAKTPMRRGQKTLEEVLALMSKFGFRLCGSNIGADSIWGDVVFVHQRAIKFLGWRFHVCRAKGLLSRLILVDHWAVLLKRHAPVLYRILRQAYLRLGF